MAQTVKNLPATRETQVTSLGQEDALGQGMATQSGTPAWRIPRTQEPGGLQSTGSRRVGQDRATHRFTFVYRKVQTPPPSTPPPLFIFFPQHLSSDKPLCPCISYLLSVSHTGTAAPLGQGACPSTQEALSDACSVRDSRHAQPGGVSCPLLTRGPLGSQGGDGRRRILSQVGEDTCHARSPSQEDELGFEPRTPSSKSSFDLSLGTEKLSARRKKVPPRP